MFSLSQKILDFNIKIQFYQYFSLARYQPGNYDIESLVDRALSSSLLTRILDLFYPPKCVLCGKLLCSGTEQLCQKCKALPDQSATIQKSGLRFRECVSALPYREPYRSSLLRYKFTGCSYYAEVYGPLIAAAVRDRLAGKYDLISYIPLSRWRKHMRGYDQAKLLAEALGKELDTDVVCTLVKVRNPSPQSRHHGLEERRHNIKNAYRPTNTELYQGKRILLVDDILTTGSTMSEAAGVLLDHGAKSVCGAVAASVR